MVTQKFYQPGGICINRVIFPWVYQNKLFTSTKMIHATLGRVCDSLNNLRVLKISELERHQFGECTFKNLDQRTVGSGYLKNLKRIGRF
jgi:hypothetical protein